MKRLLLAVLAGGALAALLAVAAPALSARPYVPRPIDFELAAPPGARAARPGPVTSPPLRAPKRFNIVGLRWRGAGEARVSLRVRAAGGRWSPWRAVQAEPSDGPDPGRGEPARGGASAPLWAGQADWVQFRSSRALPGARLHFVNSTGTATAAERARTAVRRVASRGLMAVAGSDVAHAAGARPGIVTRAEWGADQHCVPRVEPEHGEVKAAFVHHTVTANEYSRAEAPAIVLGICRYHRDSNGWNDIGYNFLVDRYGTIYEGRGGGVDGAVVGAQAQGFNAQSTGISNIGNFSSVPQTRAAIAAMARLIRWKLPLHGQPVSGTAVLTSAGGASNRWPAGTQVTFNRIAGHRDGNATSCPGAALYAQLPSLRRRVTTAERTPVALTATPSAARVRVGDSAVISGRVRPPRPGVVVTVERRVGRRYRRVAALRARAATGRYARSYRPRLAGRYRFRAVFAGDREHLAGRSAFVFVRALRRPGGAAPAR